jgi:MFS family permease
MAIVSLVPNLPLLFRQFGAAPHAGLLVPMVLTIPSLCIALLSPLIGVLADRWGRRRVLLWSLVIFSVVGVLPIFLHSLVPVLLTRFPVGIAEAGIMTSQNALLGDYFSGQTRQKWLGRLSVVNPILAALLVLAGGALGSVNWSAPFLLYLLGIPILVWAFASLHEPAKEPAERALELAPAPASYSHRAVVLAVIAMTLSMSTLYYVQAVQLGRIFGEYGIGSSASIGLYVTIASLGVIAGGWVYPKLARLDSLTKFGCVLLAYAVGYAGLGLAGSATAAIPVALIAQFGNGLAIPAMIGWCLDRFQPSFRGRGMGIWAACFFAGTFLSPPLVSLVQTFTTSFLSAVTAVGAMAGVAAAVVFGVRLSRATRPNS